ncbi:uncharacterized protein FOMMEDRAFT_152015 [Fomitiporia mediterranea MF3/22]|uniref:uncharacterized protein n=1 Tax=Fomitiporia mediterranea (strain MF3/22) TaxID=694068 RepID=UPI00044073DD|nr:uncharacterized protein FOMMEDRAFT_152015 [Fomitiporia mediterranea MF3/22]EJD06713.1 hypothetical protein FOMMEDRAFT_152015 [Fomitiporia mediterranea MF3/22]
MFFRIPEGFVSSCGSAFPTAWEITECYSLSRFLDAAVIVTEMIKDPVRLDALGTPHSLTVSILCLSMDSFPFADLLDLQTAAKEVHVYRASADVTSEEERLIADCIVHPTAATLTLFIYDYFCTLEDEIRLVWPSRWSFIKCVYFLNRASAFLASFFLVYLLLVINEGSCRPSLFTTALMGQLTFVIGEIVLFMRVYAIWCCSRRMLILLLLIYIPGVVGSTYANLHATSTAITATFPELFDSGCLVIYTSTDFWACYLVLLFHETFMLVLILMRAFRFSGYKISKILKRIVQDGIFYYICVLGMSVANLLVLLLATKNLRTFLIFHPLTRRTQGVLHSIFCARLLLRLRGAYRSLTTEGLQSMRFRSGATGTTETDNDHPSDVIPLQTLSASTLHDAQD